MMLLANLIKFAKLNKNIMSVYKSKWDRNIPRRNSKLYKDYVKDTNKVMQKSQALAERQVQNIGLPEPAKRRLTHAI